MILYWLTMRISIGCLRLNLPFWFRKNPMNCGRKTQMEFFLRKKMVRTKDIRPQFTTSNSESHHPIDCILNVLFVFILGNVVEMTIVHFHQTFFLVLHRQHIKSKVDGTLMAKDPIFGIN